MVTMEECGSGGSRGSVSGVLDWGKTNPCLSQILDRTLCLSGPSLGCVGLSYT